MKLFEYNDNQKLRDLNTKTMKEGVAMSYSKLKGKIKEYFGTYKPFANAMGKDLSSLSAKLNNKSPWKREEIEKACELLQIPLEEVYLYFFYKES